jgi:hypothetical protein
VIGELALSTNFGARELEEMDDADLEFWTGVLDEASTARRKRGD